MHYLSIIAMFKNESSIIEQWIQHYLLEGVDHFYLIDNGSDDDYEMKIKKYRKRITLIKDNYRQKLNTQNVLINKYFLEIIKKESTWVIICDIDEYIFNVNYNSTIKNYLMKNSNVDKLFIPWKLFAANKLGTVIPDNLILSLTIRKKDINKSIGFGKSIVKCKNLIILETHNSSVDGITKILTLNDELHCNHYKLISEKYFKDIKCKRGGGQSGFTNNYTIKHFHLENKLYNEIIDHTLKNKLEYLIKHFNYIIYKNRYNDLQKLNNVQLWRHWISYGIIEDRKCI